MAILDPRNALGEFYLRLADEVSRLSVKVAKGDDLSLDKVLTRLHKLVREMGLSGREREAAELRIRHELEKAQTSKGVAIDKMQAKAEIDRQVETLKQQGRQSIAEAQFARTQQSEEARLDRRVRQEELLPVARKRGELAAAALSTPSYADDLVQKYVDLAQVEVANALQQGKPIEGLPALAQLDGMGPTAKSFADEIRAEVSLRSANAIKTVNSKLAGVDIDEAARASLLERAKSFAEAPADDVIQKAISESTAFREAQAEVAGLVQKSAAAHGILLSGDTLRPLAPSAKADKVASTLQEVLKLSNDPKTASMAKPILLEAEKGFAARGLAAMSPRAKLMAGIAGALGLYALPRMLSGAQEDPARQMALLQQMQQLQGLQALQNSRTAVNLSTAGENDAKAQLLRLQALQMLSPSQGAAVF